MAVPRSRLSFIHSSSLSKCGIELEVSDRRGVPSQSGTHDIILIGHSLGGLLVRQAYMLAATEQTRWANCVSRIALFAAVNRGVDHDKSVWRRLSRWLYRVVPFLQGFIMYDLLRGSDFITNLRIEWIRYFDKLGQAAPLVTQILGTKDGIVSRDDSIDIEQFPNTFHVSIPNAGHGDLFRLDVTADPETRYALIKDALTNIRPVQGEQRHHSGPEKVFMVVHGIRASNREWVKQAKELIELKTDRKKTAVIDSTYRWFSALKFAMPMTRKKNIQWFQDQYSEQMARSPRAEFNFIGHSNGTYLLGEGLKNVPGMKFNRVVLVGSVLPTQYSWREVFKKGQVAYLRNERSSQDFPVGILCSALHGIGMRDIGTGGFDGFDDHAGVEIVENFWL